MKTREILREQVWQKAQQIPGIDPEQFRIDESGGVIKKADFNNKGSLYGWCYDYIQPVWEGGSSDLLNLKPLSVLHKMLVIANRFQGHCRAAS